MLTRSRTASILMWILLLLLIPCGIGAREIHMSADGSDDTGDGSEYNPYRTLKKCSTVSQPGDSIVVHYGIYPAETSFIGFHTYFRGRPGEYITVLGRPSDVAMGLKPIYDGGASSVSCVSMTARYNNEERDDPEDDIQYITIKNIVFRNFLQCGINIDDGGENSRHSPAHHITIENCEFYNSIDRHGLKISGVDTFIVRNCDFRNIKYNCIDQVGCHSGEIYNNHFHDNLNVGEGVGVMCKGGSSNIKIYKNVFRNLYYFGVEIGQSTDANLVRPPAGEPDYEGQPMDYESKNIMVYRNMFINVGTPIRWSCSRGGKVFHNTFYVPGDYYDGAGSGEPGGINAIVTIHQDHNYFGSIPVAKCRDGEFKNNLAFFGSTRTGSAVWVQSSETEPETFVLSNNLWHCWKDTTKSMPDWELLQSHYGCPQHFNDITGDPLFLGAEPTEPGDFRPSINSPATHFGLILDQILSDFFDLPYADPPVAPARTIGAVECIFGETAAPLAPSSIRISPR